MTATSALVPAVAGVPVQTVLAPRSIAECVEVLQSARARRWALAPVGGGTKLGLGAPPSRLDAVVSSRGLDRVVEYAPSDQVVVVEAGMTIAALQGVVAERGQRLACDPSEADRATVGGVLATNDFGPLRTRYGSPRDLIIGVSVVRADGAIVHGGGKVVKNVAGFDLPKLMVGSFGTLGMIATAAFRLHPLPETETTLSVEGLTATDVRAIVLGLRQAQLEPSAIAATSRPSEGESFALAIRFDGFRAGVVDQRDRASRVVAATAPAARVDEAAEAQGAAIWRAIEADRRRGDARLKLAAMPSAFPSMARDVLPSLAGVLGNASIVTYPSLGIVFVAGDAADEGAFQRALVEARRKLGDAGTFGSPASLVVQEIAVPWRAAVDVWGPPGGAFALMKRVKARFDPDGRMNPGRFVGGI